MNNLQMNGVVCVNYGGSAVFSKTLIRTMSQFTLHLEVGTLGNLKLSNKRTSFSYPVIENVYLRSP